MSKHNKNEPVWTAHMNLLHEDGLDAVEALDHLAKEVNRPDVVQHLILGEEPKKLSVDVSVRRDHLMVLIKAWEEYKANPTTKTFGQRLGLEASGQGNRRAIKKIDKARERLVYALDVHSLLGNGYAKNRAEELVAEEFGVSIDTVHKAIGLLNKKTRKKMTKNKQSDK